MTLKILPATLADLDALEALEKRTFDTDRLSRRSLRRWLTSEHRAFLKADMDGELVGYALVILHRGTSLARLYSIAISDTCRGQGLGRTLMQAAEKAALDAGRIYLRLEVRKDNPAAIALYESMQYLRFGEYRDYYEDHQDALRYQKQIRHFDARLWQRPVPWYRQTTDFTCGPASLMMAMQALDHAHTPRQREELQLWREATTIFMTAGHGGCHPLGLALAAVKRGFDAEVWISQRGPLFVDSVRSEEKKHIIEMVHKDFVRQSKQAGITVHYREVTQSTLTKALKAGGIPLILISTWQMDGKRTPHWVVLSAFDDDFLYLHDSDPEEGVQTELDCQYLPVARADFDRMARFGRNRLRTAVVIRPKHISRS
ncbi:N-acetyltransferase GCN5 [Alcanivorax sp. S71-1-4]|uniref:peptidase C39 family protein n=1 Tax=Alcanivorax sp. S71-1-4 TaxID=1177159 RepID=UPI00135A41AF|nr:peptidase C39 family protein [Alcanivorax sp. S71-1-4]KAF0809920.1 N-acetyltransferase GCN5 [Alcanivorax sp. S71-1-4]